ncbi:MAG: hypothetical protein FJW35_14190, partial [Acidobacteria bacterium]|nr:hypothetical protein [Acidobacteriota bacterium]
MRLDRLTIKSQEAIRAAQAAAEAREHPQLEPEHLLEALMDQEDGLVQPMLRKLGAQPEALRGELLNHAARQPKVRGAQP